MWLNVLLLTNYTVLHPQVASRRVIQVGSCLVVLVGMFGKIGALLGTIPSPVVGGVLLAVMSACFHT